MSTILLSFLGTGNYQPSRYEVHGVSSPEVTYYSAALAQALKIDSILSFQTTAALEKHGKAFEDEIKRLGVEASLQVISIPEGKSEGEYWEIFRILTEHVTPNSEVYFDITHGFRSLPALGLVALSYLKVTRSITIGGVFYGAWEATDRTHGLTPTFDLTQFITLLDWTGAADQFLSTGSCKRVGELLKNTQHVLRKQSREEHALHESSTSDQALPRELQKLARALNVASDNLLLLRIPHIEKSAHRLTESIVNSEKETAAFTLPFLEVIEPIRKQLTKFGDTNLKTLCDLVEWLAERDQTQAALVLAGEWLVNFAMILCDRSNDLMKIEERELFSHAISVLNRLEKEALSSRVSEQIVNVHQLLKQNLHPSLWIELGKISEQIKEARNDLSHAGFRSSSKDYQTLRNDAKEAASKIQKLYQAKFDPTEAN